MMLGSPPPRGTDPRLTAPGPGLDGPGLLRMLLLGCVVGLLLGSRPLVVAAEKLPDWAQPMRDAAGRWDGAMQRVGLGAPYAALHRTIQGWTR
jgi:hypothetical protein